MCYGTADRARAAFRKRLRKDPCLGVKIRTVAAFIVCLQPDRLLPFDTIRLLRRGKRVLLLLYVRCRPPQFLKRCLPGLRILDPVLQPFLLLTGGCQRLFFFL